MNRRAVDLGSSSAPSDEVLASLEETLRLMQRTIGYAEGTAMAFDPAVMLPTQFAATVPIDPERALIGCRNEQQDVDVLKFRDLAVAESPVATLSIDCDPECGTSIRWQELNLPRGRRHELRAAMVDSRGSCWGALGLYRHDAIKFSPSDLQAVRRLLNERSRHLALSMASSRSSGSPEEATTLMINDKGQVIDAPDRARRWLGEMRRSDTLDRVGMLLASIAARIRSAPPHQADGAQIRVRMRSAGGLWTTLLAEQLAGTDTTSRGISVVVMPTDSKQLFTLLVAAFDLSAREADVVRQVLKGLDTKSISARLSISVNTVQDHLKSVFDKTGVRSRRELAYLLTREPHSLT
jgi:DNA-binding CsgD family transcriptional regulator